MAICRVFGPPDFFVTFTCDVNWPEIKLGILESGQHPSDRADIVVRVYNMKLEEMLDDIKSGKAFGPILAGNSIKKFAFKYVNSTHPIYLRSKPILIHFLNLILYLLFQFSVPLNFKNEGCLMLILYYGLPKIPPIHLLI